MTTNNLLNEDDKRLLAEENEIWNEKFQGFHKKVFNEMRTQAIFYRLKFWNQIEKNLVMMTLKIKLMY